MKIFSQGAVEAQGSPEELVRKGFDFARLIGIENEPKKLEKPEPRSRPVSSISLGDFYLETCDDDEVPPMELEKSSKGQVKGNVFMKYFAAGAHWSILLAVLCLFAATQVLASSIDLFVSVWTRQEELRLIYGKRNETENIKAPALSTYECIWIHGGLIFILSLALLSRSLGYFKVVARASQKLHEIMFGGIISTSMKFFNTNPSGRILNRFSKDMGAVDEIFPKTVIEVIQITLIAVGLIALTAYNSPLSLLPVVFLSSFFFFASKIYLRTSRNLKRLGQISKYSNQFNWQSFHGI